jgi:aminobenzoyl-glutamate utilization protein B
MNAKSKKNRVDKAVQAQAGQAIAISRQIHTWAERPFREVKSSQRLAEYLAANGFKIEFPFKKIATAFRAVWGTGKPVVGLLGEYDALPNCGVEEGAWGHG